MGDMQINGQAAHRNGLKSYMRGVAAFPRLEPDEELKLGTVIQQMRGSSQADQARERLITGSLRLVISVAIDYHPGPVEMEDLIAEGNVGLMTAADRFNPVKFRTRFSTYATFWIKDAIRTAMLRARLIRLPPAHIRRLNKVLQAPSFKPFSDEQAIGSLAVETGLSTEEVQGALSNRHTVVSLHARVGDSKDTFDELIPDDGELPDSCFRDKHDFAKLVSCMSTVLNTRQAEILLKRFGCNGSSSTLQELAQEYGSRRQSVAKAVEHSLSRIRRHLA